MQAIRECQREIRNENGPAQDGAGRDRVSATPSDNAEEAWLVEAGRRGDRVALHRLLSPYETSLYRLCRGILGHRHDAEDAVQETFLHALRALANFKGACAFRTWLFRIAVNVCLDWKGARRVLISAQDASELQETFAASPEHKVLARVQADAILRTLRPQQRAVLLLKELEGWSISEIAAALKWNEKKVHNELYATRRALAAWRRDHEAEEAFLQPDFETRNKETRP